MFTIVSEPIVADELRRRLFDSSAGGFVSFEGWVRNHNEGKAVVRLEYEAYVPLAVKEGERIFAEARSRFNALQIAAVHRMGALAIGDVAVWVGASAAHRDAAFAAARYVIDEIKHCVPIWKRELYVDGTVSWVNCAACAHHGTNASQV